MNELKPGAAAGQSQGPSQQRTLSTIESLPRVQRVSAVLWPSFLLAGLANVVFFALLDPFSLIDYSGEPPLSRTAAYSLGFFCFWVLTGAASLCTLYFLSTRVPPPYQFSDDMNEQIEGRDGERRDPRVVDE
jgi:hypothetical protein